MAGIRVTNGNRVIAEEIILKELIGYILCQDKTGGQLAKEQAASLEKVSAESDELQVRNQKMNEFIQEFQERTHKLKMEKQQLFFENHEMQEEM